MEIALNEVEHKFITVHFIYTYISAKYWYHSGYFYDLQEIFDF